MIRLNPTKEMLLNFMQGSNGYTIDNCPITPENLARLVHLEYEGVITHTQAKKVFAVMWDRRCHPDDVVVELGFDKIVDEETIDSWVSAAIKDNPNSVMDYKNGKVKAIGALIGYVMKISNGRVDPKIVTTKIKDKLH